jgi:hypothetical protein
MTLKVIGAGLGRTGTLSLKLALEHIGFGPCYHAMEIPAAEFKPAALWSDAIRGSPDWDVIFDGYQSTTDYPGCCFWPELMDHYPEAKVVLSVRDAEGWFESISSTLFSPAFRATSVHGPMGELNRFFTREIEEDRLGDRAFMVDYFNRWNQTVIDSVPADRLLVFSAKEGWGPLCRFLGVPVPEAPYPRVNSRDELTQAVSDRPATLAEAAMKFRAHLDQLRLSAFGSAV